MEFIYLDEKDMLKAGVSDMHRCIGTMEDMLKLLSVGDYRMSGASNNDHGARVKFPEKSNIAEMPLAAADRWFTAMPAYLGGRFHMFGIKSYGSNHENAAKGLPRSVLMMQLLDVDTGIPLAYMSANIMSAMRTGAIAGVGAKWLAPKSVQVLCIIGPGVMSRYAFDAIMTVQPTITEIRILGRGKNNKEKFLKWCREKYQSVKVVFCNDTEEACKNADIVFTGNTRAEIFEDNPYINEKYIKKGALVIASSSVRYDREFLSDIDKCVCTAEFDKIYEPGYSVDATPNTEETKNQVTYNGYLHERCMAGNPFLSLADSIYKGAVERDYNKIYIYGAYGMPVEDVAWGHDIYMNALEKNIGTKLELWKDGESAL